MPSVAWSGAADFTVTTDPYSIDILTVPANASPNTLGTMCAFAHTFSLNQTITVYFVNSVGTEISILQALSPDNGVSGFFTFKAIPTLSGGGTIRVKGAQGTATSWDGTVATMVVDLGVPTSFSTDAGVVVGYPNNPATGSGTVPDRTPIVHIGFPTAQRQMVACQFSGLASSPVVGSPDVVGSDPNWTNVVVRVTGTRFALLGFYSGPLTPDPLYSFSNPVLTPDVTHIAYSDVYVISTAVATLKRSFGTILG